MHVRQFEAARVSGHKSGRVVQPSLSAGRVRRELSRDREPAGDEEGPLDVGPILSSPRMVRVTGTTMISFSERTTKSRASSSTGRLLSGAANAYQRISPRCTELAIAAARRLSRNSIAVVRGGRFRNALTDFASTHRRPSVFYGPS
jgi:hypothetical protein